MARRTLPEVEGLEFHGMFDVLQRQRIPDLFVFDFSAASPTLACVDAESLRPWKAWKTAFVSRPLIR